MGAGEKNAVLTYLGHLCAPEMVEPLVDWVVRQKDDHGLLGRVGAVLSKQREHAIVPILRAACSADVPDDRRQFLLHLARSLIVSSPPIPGVTPPPDSGGDWRMTEEKFSKVVQHLTQYAEGTDFQSFPRPASDRPDSPWPDIAKKLHALTDTGHR